MGQREVEQYFSSIGRDDLQIMQFGSSSATVDLAASALGVAPQLIAKTLTYKLPDRDIVLVMCGTARVSNRKFKAVFQSKAKMLAKDEALAATGHAVGGVCPFGLKNPLDVYLDQSLSKFEYVYPAAGEANNAVKIKVAEFADIVAASWVDVTESQEEDAQ